MKVLEYLANTIGPRVSGTQGEYIASRYIYREFKALGLEAEIQEFSFLNWLLREPPRLRILEPEQMDLPVAPMSYTLSTSTQGIVGKVKKAGKMFIIPGHVEWPKYAIQNEESRELGCFVANPNGPAIPMPNTKHMLPMTSAIIGKDSAHQLDAWLGESKEVRAWLYNAGGFEPARSQNVIGMRGKGTPEVVVCAHYDSVYYSAGAVDNASGVQVVCDIASRILAEDISGLAPIAFIAMGCEEPGFFGSRYYVKQLKEAGLLENIRFCINFDMVGNGSTFVLRAGQGSGERLMGILDNTISQGKYSIRLENARPSSDNWSFEEEGIPNVQITVVPGPSYHEPADVVSHVDPDIIAGAGEIGYGLIRSLSRQNS
jgi:aminopeptidase YwaD